MTTPIKNADLAQLQARYPDATRQVLASGASLITIPRLALPAGWNSSSTSVRFIEPAQYPFAPPDCFWADQSLRLVSGLVPQNTLTQVIPETHLSGLWFSWHVSNRWNPNTDSLLTWTGCIGDRLRKPQ